MKFARHRTAEGQRPIVQGGDGRWRDLTSLTPDLTAEFVAVAGTLDLSVLPEINEPTDFVAPLASVGKIVCVGLNYRDHAAETGAEPPREPILFLKAADTVIGPDDDVLIPRRSVKTDWEVELAIVMGTTARYLDSVDDAAACIAGYTISNDVSEREFQIERGGQWDKGKNCETFNPLGPWLVTPDEVPDPQNLGMRLWVNGVQRQDGNTSNMIFGVDYLVWYISQFMVLYPGDVINSGTPAGVAMGMTDTPYLRDGDVVEVEIDGLGRQRQAFIQA